MSDFFNNFYASYRAIRNSSLNEYNLSEISSYGLDYKLKSFLEHYYSTEFDSKVKLRDALTKWQYEAFLEMGAYAKKNSSFYKDLPLNFNEKLEELSFAKQSDIFNSSQLDKMLKAAISKLPFTQATDIINDSLSLLAISQDEIEGLVSVESSGTSSKNSSLRKRIYCTLKDFESTIQFFFFGMQYILRKSDEKVLMLMSGERVGSIGYLFSIAMERLNIPCKVLPFSTDYAKLAEMVIDFDATCLVGLPWHMAALSNHMHSHKLKHKLRSVLLSGDTASQAVKKQISQDFLCEVFNHYGITEFGFAGAVECVEHKALHLRALDLYAEIIDENGKSLEDGLFGELVITTLTREAMPLIRYKTGDRARIVTDECACGSILPCVEVYGRIEQGVKLSQEMFLHLIDFQEFFYNYTAFKISDFDICIFCDSKLNENILLIGIQTESENDSKVVNFNELSVVFSEKFSLAEFSDTQRNEVQNKMIDNDKFCHRFYMCSMEKYFEIFENNSPQENLLDKNSNLCSTKNAFDSLLNSAKTQNNLVTAKKRIRNLSGNLF